MTEWDDEEDDGDEEDENMECWCGATGPYDVLCDDSGLDESCGGLMVLYCHCGGDFCVCHYHGQIECPGCPDCKDDDVDYDGPGYDGYADPPDDR